MKSILKIKFVIPRCLAIIFIFLMCVPTDISGFDGFFPALDIMAIYYWSIYRPKSMGNGFVFFLGSLKDLLMGTPFGINALTNLVLRILISYKGDNFRTTFISFWHGFAIILSVCITIKWLIFSFVAGQFVNFDKALLQFLTSVLFYPVVHSFFNVMYTFSQRKLLNA